MNSSIKSLLWLAAAAGAVYFGFQQHQDRQQADLELQVTGGQARARELDQNLKLARAKVEVAQGESVAGAGYEDQFNASTKVIEDGQKQASALMEQWIRIDNDRAEAIKAVREAEFKKPPSDLILKDGTKLEAFVLRSVTGEKMVSAEHSSGIIKLPAEKLPDDLKARLALGWIPQPPAVLNIDKNGKLTIKENAREEAAGSGDPAVPEDDNAPTVVDTSSVVGLTKSLGRVEAQLTRTQAALEAERANLRKLGMFKSEVIGPGGKSYGVLKKEGNARLAALAAKLQRLRAEKKDLEHRIKIF